MKLRTRGGILAAPWLVGLAVAQAAVSATAAPPSDQRGDYGVMLAMSGQSTRAESLFVSMLSDARSDARARNNLGNLRVLRGDLGVALAFYDRALRGDSTDAGIRLNRATTLMLLGDETRAEEEAARAVHRAGGVNQAEALLGIASEKEPAKAAEKPLVSQEEIRALLKRATASVPATRDTVTHDTPAAKKKTPMLRSAGPRAAEGSDAGLILYWKR